ncbi:MAG: glycoside hydrolase family 127 protein, partial [Gemmataceae bacterium]
MRRFDVHSAGSFSSGEQANGDSYPLRLPIETCCTIAWQAITVDALRLTGDATIADELERTTFNAVAAAQHPSGAWWTYNTPLNGVRKASHHDIVFQARAGAPDLNCCSVNGPRGLGALAQWAVMRSGERGLAVNFYGPGRADVKLPGGEVTLRQETDYPVGGRVKLTVGTARPLPLTVRLRIPAWSRRTRVTVNGEAVPGVVPGRYLAVERTWKDGDRIELEFDLRMRYEAGDGEAAGLVALFRGPLLLAYDQAFNAFDEDDLPRLDAAALDGADLRPAGAGPDGHEHAPWLLVTVPAAGGRAMRLCDFASAGSAGTRYRSWLAADRLRPPAPAPLAPADGATVAPGAIRFRWRSPAAAAPREHAVVLSTSPEGTPVTVRFGQATGSHLVLPAAEAARLEAGKEYYWRVVAANRHGETSSVDPARRLRVDPKLPLVVLADTAHGERAADRVLIEADLRGDVQPSYGRAGTAAGWRPVGDGAGRAVAFDGKS